MLTTLIEKLQQPQSAESNGQLLPAADNRQKVRLNLKEHGFKRAGATSGDYHALANDLEDIRNGYIVDVSEDENEQQRDREKRAAEIEALQKQKGEKEAALRKIKEVEIPETKETVSRTRQQIDNVDLDKQKNTSNKNRSKFNLGLYWPVFLFATIFLWGFYTSAFHTAFFRNIGNEITQADASNISNILNTIFNIQAFKEFNLHWFAPIIFFVFGLVLHIVVDQESKSKYVSLAAVLLLILTADCLVAYFIEENSHVVSQITGQEVTSVFYKSPRFYLVLFLGFFTCLGWSIILHAIKQEYLKTDADEIARLQKKHLQNQETEKVSFLQEIQKKAIDLEGETKQLETTIERKVKQLDSVFFSTTLLEKRITAFYSGWITFISQLSDNAALIEASESTMNEFKNTFLKKSENQNQLVNQSI
jgi:hypothetical protein